MNLDDVRALQRDLKALGFYAGEDDGVWGPQSRAAWGSAAARLRAVSAPASAPPEAMATGADGVYVMHEFESCRLTAYPDPGSPLGQAMARAGLQGKPVPTHLRGLSGAPWTIGWGDTGPDVVEGLTITQAEADARFTRRLANEFEPAVRAAVRIALTQRQFDALVSFAYNVGTSAFAKSTLVRKLNAGDWVGATAEFMQWVKSGGRELLGLKRRRRAEQLVFMGTPGREAVAAGKALVE